MTDNNEFGRYLKRLREGRSPIVTQDALGKLVGKTKMTISLIEQGKNDPPQGDFLQNIASALELSDEEKTQLFDFAAVVRGVVPQDIKEYFHGHSELRHAIRRAQRKKLTDADWANMIK